MALVVRGDDGMDEITTMEIAVLALLAAGPVVCMVLGAMVIRRSVRPLAAIESQLGRAAVAVCPTELEFNEVPASGARSAGLESPGPDDRRQREAVSLEQRAAAALQPVLAKHGNSALNSLPDGIAVTDEQGRITFANLALGAICGQPGKRRRA